MKKSELRQLIREEISKVLSTNEINLNPFYRRGKNPKMTEVDKVFYKFAEPSYKAFLTFVEELKQLKNSEDIEEINARVREFLEDTYDIGGLESYDFIKTLQIK